jgi:hypothetical protein
MAHGARGHGREGRLLARRPLIWGIALVLALGVAVSLAARWTLATDPACQDTVVPAYFYSSATWAQAAGSKPVPNFMILDITGMGAGNAPNPHFATVVRQAQAAGITILGYSSTENGARAVSAVEADARNYRAWYHVTRIFLDVVNGGSAELPYYRQLANYIHHLDPGSSVWLNPGDYPDQGYMSVGDVINVFEGPVANYLTMRVPSWVSRYSAGRFVQTIYAVPAADLDHVIKLSRGRHAGIVYVTNGSGSNPYRALPSYWSSETTTVSAPCPAVQPSTAAGHTDTTGG